MTRERSINLAHLTGQLGDRLRQLLGEHIRLELDHGKDLPPVLADARNVEQIIMHLSVNARDAMPSGGTLTIRTRAVHVDACYARFRSQAVPGGYVSLSVTDTGIGMDAAIKEGIGKTFFTTNEVGAGMGLGLAAVHGLVQQHQGWVEFDTQRGIGSSFRVFFPAADGRDAAQPTAAAVPSPCLPGSKLILYAEDEPNLRAMLAEVLQQYGYRLLLAANGAEALELWTRHKTEIDLLLTDMVMPGHLTGRQLYDILAAERPELKVVFTSGYTGEVLGECGDLKEDLNFLPKPHSLAALAAILARNFAEPSQAA